MPLEMGMSERGVGALKKIGRPSTYMPSERSPCFPCVLHRPKAEFFLVLKTFFLTCANIKKIMNIIASLRCIF